jgi:hypothetical protein
MTKKKNNVVLNISVTEHELRSILSNALGHAYREKIMEVIMRAVDEKGPSYKQAFWKALYNASIGKIQTLEAHGYKIGDRVLCNPWLLAHYNEDEVQVKKAGFILDDTRVGVIQDYDYMRPSPICLKVVGVTPSGKRFSHDVWVAVEDIKRKDV